MSSKFPAAFSSRFKEGFGSRSMAPTQAAGMRRASVAAKATRPSANSCHSLPPAVWGPSVWVETPSRIREGGFNAERSPIQIRGVTQSRRQQRIGRMGKKQRHQSGIPTGLSFSSHAALWPRRRSNAPGRRDRHRKLGKVRGPNHMDLSRLILLGHFQPHPLASVYLTARDRQCPWIICIWTAWGLPSAKDLTAQLRLGKASCQCRLA